MTQGGVESWRTNWFSLNCQEAEALPEITADGAVIYAVSTDSSVSQEAFREQLGVPIEQLSDFEPKGATAKRF